MGLRKGSPIPFAPRGVGDTLDSTSNQPGSMSSLANLIPDTSTSGLFACRPAQVSLTTFAPFTTPTFISIMKVVGTYAFGMVSSSRFANKDEPFAYNLLTNTFTTISGVTNANTPVSQASSGTWVPPVMDIVGAKVLVCHPGFAGVSYFGVIDISNSGAPTWTAQNTTTNALPAVPVSVAQFNNRAYWLVNPGGTSPSGVYASDVLAPTSISGTNILNFDDNIPCTAMAGLPMNNQSGGVVQSLMVFKGAENVYQIQGDPATTGSWSRNTLNINTGTLSPRSIAITPEGLAFLAPDGLRVIGFTGNIGPVVGNNGDGVVAPFLNSADPTRIAAATNASIYRISVKPAATVTWVEYWYDFNKNIWTGPHTCPNDVVDNYNNTFVAAPVNARPSLQQADYQLSGVSTFTEYGTALSWTWNTSVFPDTGQMAENFMVETTIHMALQANNGLVPVVSVYALDSLGNQLGTYSITLVGKLWGSHLWGDGSLWGGGLASLFPRAIKWPAPVVFRRLQMQATGPANSGFRIGNLFMRYQQLGYLQMESA